MNFQILLLIIMACTFALVPVRAEEARRNIVFILVDDQRHDALSCMGHPFLTTPRWKYVRAYGLCDVTELYDLESDPLELYNLFTAPEHQARAMQMDKRLFKLLSETDGDSIPLHRGWNGSAKEERSTRQSPWAEFPKSMTVEEWIGTIGNMGVW